jgi:hypothetical protein
LISYNGVLLPEYANTKNANKINEHLKEITDSDFRQAWSNWGPNTKPILDEYIRSELELETRSARVDFLGVWDTVPGSSFKKYGTCKEASGNRYKLDTYPPIKFTAHAVSIDEKRKNFQVLQICDPIVERYSTVSQIWFPGAHSDVGGGYGEDIRGLPDITLQWMFEHLSREGESLFEYGEMPELNPDPLGVAHWSICSGFLNKVIYKCRDRTPIQSQVHESYTKRKESNGARIVWDGEEKVLKYPINCPKRCGEPPTNSH